MMPMKSRRPSPAKVTAACLATVLALVLQPVRAERVESNLVALLTFEDATGAVVADVSGVAQPTPLTILDTNTTAWLPDGGLHILGETMLKSTGAAGTLAASCIQAGAFSVELWLTPEDTLQGSPLGGSRSTVMTISSDGGHRNVTIDQEGSRYLVLLRTTATGDAADIVAQCDAETGDTHLVLTVVENDTVHLYRNGVLQDEQAVVGNLSSWNSDYPLVMANEANGGARWQGRLDLLAVFDRALTDGEIAQHYAHGPHGGAGGPPVIVAGPGPLDVNEPAPATFRVAASGAYPLTYHWRRDGSPITGATNLAYRLAATAGTDSNTVYDVIVSNALGVVTSETARLTVQPYQPTPARIDGQPSDLTVTEPAGARFSVSAVGDAPLYYQWRRDGTPIEGATLGSYLLTPTATGDDGAVFDVVVSNAYGAVTSDVAVLTILAYVPQPPTVLGNPRNLTLTEPQAASFSVVVSGDTPLSYQWYRDDTAINGASAYRYTLDPTVDPQDDGARFFAVVTNQAGAVTSEVAVLTVIEYVPVPPSITVQPQDTAVQAPAPAVFSVTAAGDPPLSYQWYANGSLMSGSTNATVALSSTSTNQNGYGFSVRVSSPYGAVTSRTATLTVTAPPPVPPVVTTHPQSTTVTAPAGAYFHVVASGDSPLFYRWLRDGVPVTGAVSAAYSLSATTTNDNGAAFQAVVSNVSGVVTSDMAVLTVLPQPPPPGPVIRTSPASLTVTEPEAAGFTIGVSSSLPYVTQWYRDGSAMAGATNDAYLLGSTTVAADDGALFYAVVTSSSGSATSAVAVLSVEAPLFPPPSFQQQPADITVTAPDPVGFMAGVNGGQPLLLQWFRNGQPVTGATGSAYYFGATSITNNGTQVYLVAANAAGVVTSRVATLTVRTPNRYPPVLEPLEAATVTLGGTAVVTVAASDLDGTTPTLALVAGPAGGVFEDAGNGTGTWRWTPAGAGDVGTHALSVSASDGVSSVTGTTSVTVSSFSVTAPATGTRLWPKGAVRVAWTGAWALGSVNIELWRGTNFVAVLTNGAPAAAASGSWTGRLARALPPATDYWVAVEDADTPADAAASSLLTIRRLNPTDYNGDGRADAAFRRPSSLTFYVAYSATSTSARAWGLYAADRPVAGDYDGDGRADIAVYEQNGTWHLARTRIGYAGLRLGGPYDTQVPADYDGDGRTDMAIFQPYNATWHVSGTSTGYFGVVFGQVGDIPVPADYDGDGYADIAVFRPASQTWLIRGTRVGTYQRQWGLLPTDTPVPADYDGDGYADIAVFQLNGTWHLARTSAGYAGLRLGDPGDIPVPADYDGDGRDDMAIFQPNGTWHFSRTTEGYTGFVWGAAGDVPVR